MSLAAAVGYRLYTGAVAALAPLLARRDAAKLRRQGVAHDRIAERRGYATETRPERPLVWIHAVSVGEAQSVLGLAAALSATHEILITTTSATSAEVVARRLPPRTRHQFAPIDTGRAVGRFLDHWRPDLFVLTESELWPRQITDASRRGIPVALVNARLSDRSLARWHRFRPLARHMTGRLALVLAQDARTAQGLVRLGADPERVEVTGTLKSAAAPLLADPDALTVLGEAIGGRPVWLAASTHPGEEEPVADAHRALREARPDLLLILVPRHPERGAELAGRLRAEGWSVGRRAAGEPIAAGTQIYLADTLGEMGLWFRLVRAAYLGGSLVPLGGHNPLEAVQLGAHVVTGPHITNFADIYAALFDAGTARRIECGRGLAPAIAALIDAPPAAPPAPSGPTPDAIADRLRGLRAGWPADPLVIAPNFKRRLSGVTATIVRLVPLQARAIAIRATGPGLPSHVPQIPLRRLPALPRDRIRVWHARRNVEMIGGLALKHIARRRLKLVFTSASQRRHTGLTRQLIARMDAVVATSGKSAAYLSVPATVIRHGIDTDAFAPPPDRASLRARLGLPAKATLVGCYGRIRPSKGTDLLVDAMLRLLPDHAEATALVMGRAVGGDRGFLDDLTARVARAGLARRLLFLPEVPVHRVADWYAALDLFVAPQRWEGFGLTPLEAMACGVPVVATRTGAFEELIDDGRTGTLVPPSDADALTRAIAPYLADPELRAQRGAAARVHVAERFTLQGEADALVALYRQLLGIRPPPDAPPSRT